MADNAVHPVLPSTQPDRSLSIYTLMARSRRQDPMELFLRLSREDPVHWDPYAGVWLISSRSAALQVCTDERFSALRLSGTGSARDAVSDDLRERVHDAIARQALFLDEPAHSRWQRIIRRVLAADRISALGPWIDHRIAELIGESDQGRLDVVGDLASPLPLDVIAHLLGIPVADLSVIRQWSDAYTRIVTGFEPVTDARVFSQVSEFLDYAVDLVRYRRGSPADDGIGVLVEAADALGEFSDLDIASNLIMLVAAGHQTTTGFVSGAVLECLRPRFGPVALDSPGPATVDDLLSRVSPSRFVGRHVTEDVELGGKHLRAGQSALVLLAAINWSERDDSAATTSTAMSRHVAFGLGRHHCPGARLAQLEGRLALTHLFRSGHPPTLLEQTIPWSDNVNLPCPTRVDISLRG
jgi:cytochrome P450